MENNWIYLGIFLDERSKRKLWRMYSVPTGWKEYFDHMTVVYNDKSEMAQILMSANAHNIGKAFMLKVVGCGISNKAMAVKVEIPRGVLCSNKITHITLACSPMGNPVDSNDIEVWSTLANPFYVTGIMDVFKTNTQS